jgi:hypothetical protein
MMDGDWALRVGIDRYLKAGVKALHGAVGDATRFRDWVIRPPGGGVDPGHVMLLTSPAHDQPGKPPKPAFSNIWTFFEGLTFQLGSEPGRRLYIYLSGHGISPSGQQSVRNAALLMANAVKPNHLHNFPGNVWAEGARSAAVFRESVKAELRRLLADAKRAQEAEIRCAPEADTLSRLVFNEQAEEARSKIRPPAKPPGRAATWSWTLASIDYA